MLEIIVIIMKIIFFLPMLGVSVFAKLIEATNGYFLVLVLILIVIKIVRA